MPLGNVASEAMGQCFRRRLKYAASINTEFVTSFLSGEEGQAIEAAAAWGERRNKDALAALLNACETCGSEVREAFHISAALSRQAAIEFLTSLIRQNLPQAEVALKTLAPVRFCAEISQQVVLAVKASGLHEITAAYRRLFQL